ncbi:MAG: NAD(+) synthase [Bacteroidia bacterium]
MKTFKSTIEELTAKRGFNCEDYLKRKIEAINSFFKQEKLDSAVIGLSGGIDSAVVYKLLIEASKVKNSPIKAIVGIFLPISDEGISGQSEAEIKVNSLIESTNKESKAFYRLIDLSNSVIAMKAQFTEKFTPWSSGQMACICRTPALYGYAAILQTEGYKSLVVGTTNRDEGSYIGFFGKASDAMVDLQPIADIHKSEVWDLAKLLNVPGEIVNATPKGDVWDGAVDEEMIGAPYWFLKMYLLMKEYYTFKEQLNYMYELNSEEKLLFLKYGSAIEAIHKLNAHKYKVGSPARYIDVMPRIIK